MKKIIGIIVFLIIASLADAQNLVFEEVLKLGSEINTNKEDMRPYVTFDGSRMYFVREHYKKNFGGEKAGSDIWFSYVRKDVGTTASNKLIRLNNEGDNAVIGISEDHQRIYLLNKYNKSGYPDGFGVSYSKRKYDDWLMPKNLKIPNLEYTSGSYDFDMHNNELVLIISYIGKSTKGKEDLYVSLKTDKEWSSPISLGNVINSTASDITPFLSHDTKTMYFSSDRAGGIGGQDIYMSKRLDNSWTNWSKPVNLGEPVNSTLYDGYFTLDNDLEGHFSSNRSGESDDIYFSQGEMMSNEELTFYLEDKKREKEEERKANLTAAQREIEAKEEIARVEKETQEAALLANNEMANDEVKEIEAEVNEEISAKVDDVVANETQIEERVEETVIAKNVETETKIEEVKEEVKVEVEEVVVNTNTNSLINENSSIDNEVEIIEDGKNDKSDELLTSAKELDNDVAAKLEPLEEVNENAEVNTKINEDIKTNNLVNESTNAQSEVEKQVDAVKEVSVDDNTNITNTMVNSNSDAEKIETENSNTSIETTIEDDVEEVLIANEIETFKEEETIDVASIVMEKEVEEKTIDIVETIESEKNELITVDKEEPTSNNELIAITKEEDDKLTNAITDVNSVNNDKIEEEVEKALLANDDKKTEEVVKLETSEPVVHMKEGKLVYNSGQIVRTVYHEYNKTHPGINIDDVITVLKKNPWMRITIESHTDSHGSEEYNQELSNKRASSCKTYLLRKGISMSRIRVKSWGETKPIAPNTLKNGRDNPAGRDKNRRTEFIVITNKPTR